MIPPNYVAELIENRDEFSYICFGLCTIFQMVVVVSQINFQLIIIETKPTMPIIK